MAVDRLASAWNWLRERGSILPRAFGAGLIAVGLWLFVDLGKEVGKSLFLDTVQVLLGKGAFDLGTAAQNAGTLLFSVCALPILSYLLLLMAPRLIRPRAKAKTGSELAPRRVVILTMSTMPGRSEADLRSLLDRYETMLADDILFDQFDRFFPWQACLRTLKRHFEAPFDTVVVYLLYSNAVQQCPYYLPLITEYIQMFAKKYNTKTEIRRAPKAIDYDDYIDCDRIIGDLVHDICIKRGAQFRPKDVVIDVTGGTKPVGIAGAIVSMSRDIEFSYVRQAYSREHPDIQVVEAVIDTISIQQAG